MKRTFLLFTIAIVCCSAYASHLRSGVITMERVSCISKQVVITITVITNTATEVAFGGEGRLDFGDGSPLHTVPEISATLRPDLGPNIGVAVYTYMHIYAAGGTYLISYTEPNRNAGILNMANSFQTEFCLKSSLVLGAVCANSPKPIFAPVFQAPLGSQFSVSLGSYAAGMNEFLTYEKTVPARDRNLPVIDYEFPETFQVNRLNGLVTWDTDAQDIPGEYTFAVKISKFLLLNDEFVFTGYAIVDFQVILSEQSGNNFIHDNELLDEYNGIEVSQGEEKKIRVFYESTHASPSLTAYAELPEDLFSFTQYDSTHEGRNIKVAVVTVEPDAAAVRNQPYLLTVRGTASSSHVVSDINYLIYTDGIQEIPVYTGLEKDGADIHVFPNPTREKITIQLNRPGLSEVFLYSLQGTLVCRKTFEIETNVELHELASGIYICEVRRNNAAVQRIKVVKQ